MIRLAIAGAGYIANIHAAAAKTVPDVELVAVVDKFPRAAKPFVRNITSPTNTKHLMTSLKLVVLMP
jgi:predicted dehydrogenase